MKKVSIKKYWSMLIVALSLTTLSNCGLEKMGLELNEDDSSWEYGRKDTLTRYLVTCDTIELRYPDSQWPIAEVDIDGDSLIDFIMEITPWNISSANGYQSMSYYGCSQVEFTSELTDVVLRDPGAWVHGYPEIYWGNKPWNSNMTTEPNIGLPVRISQLSDFYVRLSYELDVPNGYPFNLSADLWLTTDSCRTSGVGAGDAEIMVWFFHQNLHPGGSFIGVDTVTLWINGVETDMPFNVWYSETFSGGWTYVAFSMMEPLLSGSVTFDPKLFVDKVRSRNLIENLDELFMEDVELGTEYGSPSNTEDIFSWRFWDFGISSCLSISEDG